MIRTTPHRLRRGLFFLNLALLVSLAAPIWLLAQDPPPADAAANEDAHMAYVRARRSGLRWMPDRPVSDKEFKAQFLRYENHRPAHWPFVGHPPPAPEPDAPPPPNVGLEELPALAHVHIVILGEGEPVVGFTFLKPRRQKVLVGPGEFIRPRGSDDRRFRLLAVERLETRLHHVHYEVLDGERVEREAFLVFDRRGWEGGGLAEDKGGIRLRVGAEDAEDDAKRPAKPGAIIIDVGTPATLESMQPTRHVNPTNRRDRVIEFDAATYRVTRGKGLGAILSHVKTAPVTDTATGRPLGVRIVGHDSRLPADRFDVRKGDILVSLAGQKVSSRADVIRIAKGIDPEQLVPVVIDRQGILHTYRVDARDPHTKREIRYFENLR